MILINPKTNFNKIREGNNRSYSCRSISNAECDKVSFRGRVGAEEFGKKGIEKLIKETGLFRDWQTLQFIKRYIEENFADNDLIKSFRADVLQEKKLYQ